MLLRYVQVFHYNIKTQYITCNNWYGDFISYSGVSKHFILQDEYFIFTYKSVYSRMFLKLEGNRKLTWVVHVSYAGLSIKLTNCITTVLRSITDFMASRNKVVASI